MIPFVTENVDFVSKNAEISDNLKSFVVLQKNHGS